MVQIATKEVLRTEEPRVGVKKKEVCLRIIWKIFERFLLNCSETVVHSFN